MQNEPNKAQRAAVDWGGRGLLLSAAAGSGKTYTLTQRVLKLVTDGKTDITRILCVTFTRAAAQELRQRIGKELRGRLSEHADAALTRQLWNLGRAHIDTIHAFCLDVLRPRAWSRFGLPATMAVADESAAAALSRSAMQDVLNERFTTGGEDFFKLADTLSGARSETSLDEVLLRVYNGLDQRGMIPDDLIAFAREAAEAEDFFATRTGEPLRSSLLRFSASFEEAFGELLPLLDDGPVAKYQPECRRLLGIASGLRAACEARSYRAARETVLLLLNGTAKLPAVKAQDQTEASLRFKSVREAFNKRMTDSKGPKLADRLRAAPPDLVREAAERNLALVTALADVLNAYEVAFSARKRDRGVVDFADLERLTERLLVERAEDGSFRPTEEAALIAASYDYVFIDEYQDTNRRQDNIFRALAEAGGVRRFMVGDSKQSIYGFRGAEPSIFTGYRQRWPELPPEEAASVPADAERSLFLQENFRCDEPVIDFVNAVCGVLFPAGTLNYDERDALVFAKGVDENALPCPVEVALLASAKKTPVPDGEEPVGDVVREAEWVAGRIDGLLAEGRYGPGDITVLLRSAKERIAVFGDALRRRGIPVAELTRASFFDEPEILLIVSVLHAADDPARDVDLAAAMKSPLWDFTLDELVLIRRASPQGSLWDAVRAAAAPSPGPDGSGESAVPLSDDIRAHCTAFVSALDAMRADARLLGADELLQRLYDGAYGNVDLRTVAASCGRDEAAVNANLLSLYERARKHERSAFDGGLYGFLLSLDSAQDGGTAAAAPEGCVRIMSIHQSKGMEFPVVFLADTGKKRNDEDARGAFLFSPDAGAAVRLRAGSSLVACDTLLCESLRCCLRQSSAEEEMRILYVAMTRARERLIVSGVAGKAEEWAARAEYDPTRPPPTAYELLDSMNCYAEWITAALGVTPHADFATVSFVPAPEGADADEPGEDGFPASADDGAAPADAPDEAFADELRRRFAFAYPYDYLRAVPAKLTVSALKPDVLDGVERGALGTELTRLPQGDDGGGDAAGREAPVLPRFLAARETLDPAFAGTATHVFMQFCDFERLEREGVQAELDRMKDAGFLTDEMISAIRTDELERFRWSEFFRRIRAAEWIRRELRFNAALPAADFTRDEALRARLAESGTDVVVQGVVDCIFGEADGTVVLADYKTDRLTRAELDDPALAAAKLLARHADQLRYYRRVCAAMLSRPIDECLLYSLPSGLTIPLPEE